VNFNITNSNPKMDDLNDQKEILEYYKRKENNYKDSDESFKGFLESCQLEYVKGEDRKMWRFAYDNALNWEVVRSKYGNMLNNMVITNERTNLQKSVSNLISDPVVLSNCVIVLKLLTSVARGKISSIKLIF
jgi:hypothetical protein